MKPTWKVYWEGVTPDPVGLGVAAGNNVQLTQELVAASEVQDLDDYAIVKRIVGQAYWVIEPSDGGSALGNVLVTQGIIVLDSTFAVDQIQLGTASDLQDLPWAYLRVYRARDNGSHSISNMYEAVNSDHLASAMMDVRVGRALRAGDRLLLYTRMQASAAVWDGYVGTNLRVLLES